MPNVQSTLRGGVARLARERGAARERGSGGLRALSDDLIIRLFVRAPLATHGTLHAVCPRLNALLRSPRFREQRLELGLAEYGMIVASGFRNYRACYECWVRPQHGGQWRPLPPMSEARRVASTITIDGELWVVGGVMKAADLATIEIYSPKTNSWRPSPPMSQRRSNHMTGVVGGLLVVAAGYYAARRLTCVEAYTGTEWIPLPPVPRDCYMAASAVLNERFYVIAGLDTSEVNVLEMTEGDGWSWSRVADLPVNRYGAASVVHDGKIWVIGGYVHPPQGSNGPTASVLIYNDEADTWENGPPLPERCGHVHAATTDGGIFLYSQHKSFVYGAGARPAHGQEWEEIGQGGTENLMNPAIGGVLIG